MNKDYTAIGFRQGCFNFSNKLTNGVRRRLVICETLFKTIFLIFVCGISLQACQNYGVKTVQPGIIDAAQIEKITAALIARQQPETEAQGQQIQALTEAVTALSNGQDTLGTEELVNTAITGLAQGKTTGAKALFAQLAENSQTEAKQKAGALRHLGILASLDNTQDALAAYRRATELEPNDAGGWRQLGRLLNQTGKSDEAIVAFQKQLELAETNQDQTNIAESYSNLADVYQARSEFNTAIKLYQKALQVNEALANQAVIAKNYNDLGNAYFNTTDLSGQAIACYQKALQLHEAIGDQQQIARQYDNLGNAYQKRGDLPNTLVMYQKALQLYEKLHVKTGIAINYRNLGIVYKTSKDLDKAIEMLQKASQIDQQLGDKNGLAIDYNHLGLAYQLKGNKTEAKRYYLLSMELFRILNNQDDAEPIRDLLDEL
ncbi:MAG: tetratricopeptide repeat protein [Methylovulum sp.]|uniref:tetratricopeptide repeat protein n=1 Tax=Methylovulum sp. TaxID=1916980 RepID=UPI002620E5F1|nr:tetratricopeptide repeat protein [Methylovulum sp.]MDD2722656.1 tetratricopeptide repeat protein [Methylovulum sp.]